MTVYATNKAGQPKNLYIVHWTFAVVSMSVLGSLEGLCEQRITKTRLFKYIENFTTKNTESLQIKILIVFIVLLKT